MVLERDEVASRLEAARGELEKSEELVREYEAALASRDVGSTAAALSIHGARADQEAKQIIVDDLILRAKRLEDTANERADANSIARATAREERREFWFRRFHLSIGIAHGAALAAVTSKVFDKDVAAQTVATTWWSMTWFAVGLVLAGLIPISLYFERPKAPWVLASMSALLFVVALIIALYAAALKAEYVWPFG